MRTCTYCEQPVLKTRQAKHNIERGTWIHRSCEEEASAMADEIMSMVKLGFKKTLPLQ